MTAALPNLRGIGTPDCHHWRQRIFDRHRPVALILAAQYKRTAKDSGYVKANQQLALENKTLKFARTGLFLHSGREKVDEYAKAKARRMEVDVLAWGKRAGWRGALEWLRTELVYVGVSLPLSDKDAEKKDKVLGAMARAVDSRWLARQLRQNIARDFEHWLRAHGQVCRKRSAYVSAHGLATRQGQRKRNAQMLLGLEAVCDETGESVNLADCASAGQANPENRRNELMVRMRGWEEVAGAMGLRGEFLTLTCPGAFHPVISKTGARNPRYNGTTPREAQDYLNRVWANIRARWHKAGIKTFGFRVAEPHHDGTPHWHLLLFFAPDEAARAWAIFETEALRENPDEAGAVEARAQRVSIDPGKGTAAGYIAKYVSKNIDGYGLADGDHETGGSGEDGARRVDAWAGIWGIRQFQQIGAVSVTVYRELRRLGDALDDEAAEAIHAAADAGDWAQFVELMGGAFVRRDAQPLRPMEVEAGENRYGEAIKRIRGVVMRAAARVFVTREKNWRIVRADEVRTAGASEAERAQGPP